ITVYDIPGSLIGRRLGIKEILNKLVKEGNNNDNRIQISIRTGTIVRNHRNSSSVM
ncbi:9412_t:CDS:2, partial [Gigaspora margarita]